MRKVIATINMSLDGYCDHTGMLPDENVHNHFAEAIRNGETILYGRIVYQLMADHWPGIVKNPTGNKAMDDFAVAIDQIQKIVFSTTLKQVDWKSASLAKRSLQEEVAALKQQAGGDIFVGSPGLIIQLTNLNLIDEYQLCVHPILVSKGRLLFKEVTDRTVLKLINTKTFPAGHIVLYYKVESKG